MSMRYYVRGSKCALTVLLLARIFYVARRGFLPTEEAPLGYLAIRVTIHHSPLQYAVFIH